MSKSSPAANWPGSGRSSPTRRGRSEVDVRRTACAGHARAPSRGSQKRHFALLKHPGTLPDNFGINAERLGQKFLLSPARASDVLLLCPSMLPIEGSVLPMASSPRSLRLARRARFFAYDHPGQASSARSGDARITSVIGRNDPGSPGTKAAARTSLPRAVVELRRNLWENSP